MKRTTVSILVFACLALVLVVIGTFIHVPTANADLGNSTVIVRCTKSDYWIAPNATSDLTCYPASGSGFVNVPSSHYLFITDFSVIPFNGTVVGAWGFNLMVPGSYINPLTWFTWSTSGTYVQHFITPVVVIKAGEKATVQNFGSSPNDIGVMLYGVLTTNENYLPLIAR